MNVKHRNSKENMNIKHGLPNVCKPLSLRGELAEDRSLGIQLHNVNLAQIRFRLL